MSKSVAMFISLEYHLLKIKYLTHVPKKIFWPITHYKNQMVHPLIKSHFLLPLSSPKYIELPHDEGSYHICWRDLTQSLSQV